MDVEDDLKDEKEKNRKLEAIVSALGQLMTGNRTMEIPLDEHRTVEIRLPGNITSGELALIAEMLLCMKEQRETGEISDEPEPEACPQEMR